MKIACCQFDPQWCNVQENMNMCDNLLKEYTSEDNIDILILPEMAFTGYVFKSLEEIMPYLEDSETGPSVQWAKKQAIRLQCYVIVGYPQKEGQSNYNSLCCVNVEGQVVSTYQKAFLYETDENWAIEGSGFVSLHLDKLGKVGFGICMDLNPRQFKAEFYDYEFANYHLDQDTEIILCTMAWLKSKTDKDPLSTIKYWALRLLPLYNNAKEGRHTIFAACNRIGVERGSEFAGNSCVLDIVSNHSITIIENMKQEIGVMIAHI